LTTHHNITFEFYLNDYQMQTVDEAAINSPCWSASDWYVLLIMVGGVESHFSQTAQAFDVNH